MATLNEGDKEVTEGGLSLEEMELERQLLKVQGQDATSTYLMKYHINRL